MLSADRQPRGTERLQLLIGAQLHGRETTQAGVELRIVRRRQRTLCEDLDELLGLVGDAVRRDQVLVAARLLDGAVAIATDLAGQLPHVEDGPGDTASELAPYFLDEASLHRTLGLLEELDAELDRTARGGGSAGAPALAGCLRAGIDALAAAAAAGRTHTLPPRRRRGLTRPLLGFDTGNHAAPLEWR